MTELARPTTLLAIVPTTHADAQPPTRAVEPTTPTTLSRLAGRRILVLNWRDVHHPQAGGAEQYMHRIARRWAAAGAEVTWLTAAVPGRPAREVVDGVTVLRAGGALSIYPRVALSLLRRKVGPVDHVVDCQNGIPFFSPLFVGAGVPVVQVVHHIHQEQFSTRFGPVMAAVGRFMEGPVSRSVYRGRPIVAVSPSTREGVRRRLRLRGPIHVVPNGIDTTPPIRSPRDPEPTIAVVSRLVPHKRVDLLLGQLVPVAAAIPRLRVDIVGDGPERARLQGLAAELGLGDVVTFHGFQPDHARDELLERAWLTTSTSDAEGWGLSIMEAAAHGVPTVALDVPGVRDSVVPGRTGWLVPRATAFGDALVDALHELADDARARELTAACQAWARSFGWDRSAELLAGVLLGSATHAEDTRGARADIGVVADVRRPRGWSSASWTLRPTDQVSAHGDRVSLLLTGCDEVDAGEVLRRLGVTDARVRLADRFDLLVGPSGMPDAVRPAPSRREAG
ncbi:glycosyltransferase family 4 protein [Pseudonocardia humida]|uniref:Glycosyltransferase family 4 protein n=1 Tax=Pseudonocardia humida TaxID=2800819 RepID=A0ABT1ABC5_9PSEU|nr:glycosyltransferase family 4 protein [Pseudonocardia humida]MCO1660266.1 glycosyltransferase family 4 protein [Pseudonocardia humida]